MTDSKYIKFNLIDRKPKTEVYEVVNLSSEFRIGVIKWYAQWSQYSFFPTEDCIFTRVCMYDINKFIEELMEKRKNK